MSEIRGMDDGHSRERMRRCVWRRAGRYWNVRGRVTSKTGKGLNMCGIVGYTGNEQAKDIIINGLKKLEYRGYDSAGIAIRNEDNIVIRTTDRKSVV